MREPQNDGDERSDDAPRVAEPESFGAWLRRQREVREIDLREIADSSKVSMSYLRAFEEDRFEVLPAQVFAKGFLRQYARYVGLDPEEVVNFYLAAHQPDDSERESMQVHTEPETPARNYLVFVLAVTAALVLLVWLLSVYGDRMRSAPDAAEPASTPAPVSAPAVQSTPAGVPAAGVPDTPKESAVVTAEPSSADFEPGVPPPVAEPLPPLRVTLDFLNDCWVEASVDGAERLSELKVQGESLLLSAQEVVEFKVGDVNAVQVEVNGEPYEIEEREGTSVRTVRIDLKSASVATAATEPAPIEPPGSSSDEGR